MAFSSADFAAVASLAAASTIRTFSSDASATRAVFAASSEAPSSEEAERESVTRSIVCSSATDRNVVSDGSDTETKAFVSADPSSPFSAARARVASETTPSYALFVSSPASSARPPIASLRRSSSVVAMTSMSSASFVSEALPASAWCTSSSARSASFDARSSWTAFSTNVSFAAAMVTDSFSIFRADAFASAILLTTVTSAFSCTSSRTTSRVHTTDRTIAARICALAPRRHRRVDASFEEEEEDLLFVFGETGAPFEPTPPRDGVELDPFRPSSNSASERTNPSSNPSSWRKASSESGSSPPNHAQLDAPPLSEPSRDALRRISDDSPRADTDAPEAAAAAKASSALSPASSAVFARAPRREASRRASSSERSRAAPGGRRAPAAVALRKLAAGNTNAMRNEHVDPVSPNANATLGTYSERYRAHVMEATATTVASRLAISGGTAARSSLVSPLCVRSA